VKPIGILLFIFFIACGCRKDRGEPALEPRPESFFYKQRVINWLNDQQLENGLVPSCETCPVSLYDQALSALVFMEFQELERAEAIFDFFHGRLDIEFRQDSGGFHQFRHWSGNPVYKHQWLGDNAWLLIALNNYEAKTGLDKYADLQFELEQWIRSLQVSTGALFAGYDGNKRNDLEVTEGIIDAFNAVSGYDAFHAGILSFLKSNRWDSAQKSLVTGWSPYPAALDLHPWAFGIFKDFPKETLAEADKYLNTPFSFASRYWLEGYCFDLDRDNVWFEGTGQMALAYRTAGDYSAYLNIMSEMQKGFIPIEDSLQMALPYVSNGHSTRFGNQSISQSEYLSPFVASNAWYLMALEGIDPFVVERDKSIPLGDMFWR